MKIFSAIRSHEWWGYKLPPLLAVGYATIIRQGQSVYSYSLVLLIILLSLAVGAVYVSLINDLTDMDEDRRGGKHNRMAGLPVWLRYSLILVSLIAGGFFFHLFSFDRSSLICYGASWLAFTLYSVPPFRLKKRGVWGVLADAGGSNLFPSLLVFYVLADIMEVMPAYWWTGSVAVWSLCYGLRGILWHQFSDRESDRRSGVRTVATGIEPERFRGAAFALLAIELAALGLMLWWLQLALPLVFLALYALLLLASRRMGMQFLVVLPAPRPPYHILMSSYYQFFLPVSLLLTDALVHPYTWVVLAVHLLLFPGQLRRLAGDLKRSVKGQVAVID